jgi:hypothetical protein
VPQGAVRMHARMGPPVKSLLELTDCFVCPISLLSWRYLNPDAVPSGLEAGISPRRADAGSDQVSACTRTVRERPRIGRTNLCVGVSDVGRSSALVTPLSAGAISTGVKPQAAARIPGANDKSGRRKCRRGAPHRKRRRPAQNSRR